MYFPAVRMGIDDAEVHEQCDQASKGQPDQLQHHKRQQGSHHRSSTHTISAPTHIQPTGKPTPTETAGGKPKWSSTNHNHNGEAANKTIAP